MTQATQEKTVAVTGQEEDLISEQIDTRLPVTFEIVRREGEHELSRPASSLWWSGVAAGICIGLSVLSQAVLAAYLPNTDCAVLIAKLGSSVGFLIVILGEQQLFTENTLTAVTPVLANTTWRNVGRLSRLWTIVLAANIVGAIIFAAVIVFLSLIHISEPTRPY